MTSAETIDYDYGPIEFVLLGFTGDQLNEGVADALDDLIESETLRLLDLVVVSRDVEGEISLVEIEDMGDELGLGTIELEASGMAAQDDIVALAEEIPPGSSAALAVVELLWAKHLASRLASSGGFVIHSERIPAPVVNSALAELATQG